jgi:hypothetical protein
MREVLQRRPVAVRSGNARRPVLRGAEADAYLRHDGAAMQRAAVGLLSPRAALQLQQQAGNRAVSRLIDQRRGVPLLSVPKTTGLGLTPPVQREFEDADKVAEDSVGFMRGPAGKSESATAKPESKNPFGEMDGEISSGVEPHAFSDLGRTGESTWHHCGGGGGKGNQTLGEAVLVAPVYKSSPAVPGKQAKAWIKKGTGTVKVTRSYTGVTHGAQGAFSVPPDGTVWMSPRARTRVDKHEQEHTKKTKEFHQTHIKPLEDRISTYRGYIKAKKGGADPAAAIAALQAEIDWNASIQAFADADTAENTPMGPLDTTDMAKADFYADFQASAKFQQTSGCTIYEGVGASKKGKT